MTTKLKIDLSGGILEVEGSEAFVKAIYKDFKLHFIGEEAAGDLQKPRRRRATRTTTKAAKPASSAAEVELTVVKTTPEPAGPPGQATGKSTKATKAKSESQAAPDKPEPTYTFINDLDLSAAADGRPSLVDFMDAKFPITNEERNLVFLHYLQYTVKIRSITVDYIYTCYRAAKIRAPLDLEGSLKSTISQKRWIKKTKAGKLSVTPAGKLYVEKQLPKKVKN
jgi:hypothetical protein